jgi:hypothetical protein
MAQNRNKLIDLFISNTSNCILHGILEKAIEDENIRNHYNDELSESLRIAQRYREQINPKAAILHEKDRNYIREKIIRKVHAELMNRISKGYTNINLGLIEPETDMVLKKLKIS